MEKTEIVKYAPGQDPETRRKVIRHPDVFPLVLDIVKETIEAIHSAQHGAMIHATLKQIQGERVDPVMEGITFMCRIDERAEVVRLIAEYVCSQGVNGKLPDLLMLAAATAHLTGEKKQPKEPPSKEEVEELLSNMRDPQKP